MQVPRSAFAFCRWSLAVLLWAAFLLGLTWPVAVVLAVLAVSAAVKVHRSPMIQVWSWTALKLRPARRYEFLDVAAMRFAHGLGALLAAATLALLLWRPHAGRVLLLGYCILKSVSALGFCPASKLFACLRKGGCCAFTGGGRC